MKDRTPGGVFLATTVAGLEDVAAAECRDVLTLGSGEIPVRCLPGAVRVGTNDAPSLLQLTTVHHVLEVRAERVIKGPDDLRNLAAAADLPELAGAASFRVTAHRAGSTAFNSLELQQFVGGELWRRHRIDVDLDEFEVEVHVHLHGHHAFLGLRRTSRDLGKRIQRARALRSSLKPTIAAALIRLAGAHQGSGRLLDPMCGAGTILLEAWRINRSLAVSGADWDRETLDVARQTLATHKVDLDLRCVDARGLADVYGASTFDFLVTDPPYGMRQGRRTGLTGLYGALLSSFGKVVKSGGRAALIAVKQTALLAGLEKAGFLLAHQRTIDIGGLQPHLFVLERR